MILRMYTMKGVHERSIRMFIAETEEKERIFADQYRREQKKQLYCPGCKGEVYFKSGPKVVPHFSHYAKEACESFSEGETREHLTGKQQLYEWLASSNEDVELEAYLPELKQRPDLLWKRKGENHLAIEFQCSALPKERMIERTKGYQENGYEVLWILGERYHVRQRFTSFQKLFLTNLGNKIPSFMQYSVRDRCLSILTQFLVKGETCLSIQKRNIYLEEDTWRAIFSTSIIESPKVVKIDLSKGQLELHRLSYYRSKKAKRFFQLLYENRENVRSLPLECYDVLEYEWVIETYSFEWKYRFLKWIDTFQPNRILTLKMIYSWVNEQRRRRQIQFYDCPMLGEVRVLWPAVAFLNHLDTSGLVKKIGEGKWTYCKKTKSI